MKKIHDDDMMIVGASVAALLLLLCCDLCDHPYLPTPPHHISVCVCMRVCPLFDILSNV